MSGYSVQVVMVMTTWLIHVALSTTTRLINMTFTLIKTELSLGVGSEKWKTNEEKQEENVK